MQPRWQTTSFAAMLDGNNGGGCFVAPTAHPSESLEPKADARTLHYQPWLTPVGAPLRTLCTDVLRSLPLPEITPGRKHRTDALRRREAALETLMANLAALVLSPLPHAASAIPLRNGKRTRYDRHEVVPRVLSERLTSLVASGYATLVPSSYKRLRTCLVPSIALRSAIAAHNVTLADVGLVPGEESIILRNPERRHGYSKSIQGSLIDYWDTSLSVKLREEMATINDTLQAADIRFDGVPLPPIHLVRIVHGTLADTVNPQFNRHGRLYRGPWINLKASERHKLTLGGEPLADLDYSAMFMQLAYVKQGLAPPEGDPYAIPGLEMHRAAVKRIVSSLWFREAGREMRLSVEQKESLPSGWTMGRFLEALSSLHPGIAPLFGTDVGPGFVATESRIMVAVLLELAASGIASLPVHDGLMVATSRKLVAAETMRRVSEEILGRELPVAEKPIALLDEK